MAITRVNALNLNTADQKTDASGNAVLSLSGLTIASGDVLVVAYCDTTQADQTYSATANNSGACTKLIDAYGNDSRDSNLAVFTAIQGATPDTSITVSGAGGSRLWSARILQYSGVDATTPVDVASVSATGIDGDDANPPSITPATTGAKIVAIYAAVRSGAESTVAWTAPANVSNFVEIITNDTTGATSETALGTGEVDWAGGAFDPDPVTGGSVSTSNAWTAATIALRPASSAAVTLSVPLLSNANTIYGATLIIGPVAVSVPLLSDGNTLYAPTLALGATTLTAPLLTNTSGLFGPTIRSTGWTAIDPATVTWTPQGSSSATWSANNSTDTTWSSASSGSATWNPVTPDGASWN